MTADVIVIGGGVSGLAAALRLSLDGAKVVLVEQGGKLGGRAYSYIDKKTGDVVDNGQHVLVGAYHNTLHYLELVGARHALSSVQQDQTTLQLNLHHPKMGFGAFNLPSLPHPLNLVTAILKYPLLPLRSRWNIVKVGMQIQSWAHSFEEKLRRWSITEWLDSSHQSEEAKRSFWYPIAISVMNELPEKGSAFLFARSLKNTFFGGKKDSTLLIPTVGQTELYIEGAKKILTHHGSKIFLNTEVTSLLIEKGKTVGVKTRNGKRINGKRFVCAVPYFALERLLPEHLRRIEPFVDLKKFESSPIVSIHLWFDREVMDREFVGLIDRDVQWVFNRRRIMRETGKPENYISAVISGAYKYVDMPKNQLVKMTIADITSAFPSAAYASLTNSVVIKEKRATFAPTNKIELFRPAQQTPIENLFLAGDWTDTELPPTIEGAIMSGFRCGELAKENLH